MLKAVIVRQPSEFPHRLHNLMPSAEVASLELAEFKVEFLRELSTYCIQTRYPEEVDLIGARVTRQLNSPRAGSFAAFVIYRGRPILIDNPCGLNSRKRCEDGND